MSVLVGENNMSQDISNIDVILFSIDQGVIVLQIEEKKDCVSIYVVSCTKET